MLIAAKALERHAVICRLGELRIARDDNLDLRIIVKRSVGVRQGGERLRRRDIEALDSTVIFFELDAFRTISLEQLDKLFQIRDRRTRLGRGILQSCIICVLLGIVSGIVSGIVAFRLVARGIGTRGAIGGIACCSVVLRSVILSTVAVGAGITRPRPDRDIALGLTALGSVRCLRSRGGNLARNVLPAGRHSGHRGRACLEHHDHRHELCEYALCRSHRFRTSYPNNSDFRVIESPSCPSG